MSVSLYRVTEDSESRLVLEGRKIGLWLLTLFLLLNASVLLYVGLFVASRRQLFPVIAGSLLGLFFAVCGVAALVHAIRYRSWIEVDRDAAVVRLARGSGPATLIPFADIASVEVEVQLRRGGRGRRVREHRVLLLDSAGDEWLIDRSGDGGRMNALADRLRDLTGALGGERGRTRRRAPPEPAAKPSAAASPPGLRDPAPSARVRAGLREAPDGVSIESDGGASLYSWRTLPRSPFWVFFYASVTLFLGSLTVLCLVGMVTELTRQPVAVTFFFVVLVAATIGLMYFVNQRVRRGGTASVGLAVLAVVLANLLIGSQPFILMGAAAAVVGFVTSLCVFVLLARCRLRLSPEGLEYEERILGLPLAWRRRSLRAADLEGLHIRAAVRGGGAVEARARGRDGFTLMIPQGPGAFSRTDLEWLRERWLRDLSR